MKVLTYHISLKENPAILDSLKAYLYSQGFTIEEFNKGNGVILQIRRGGKFKTILGLSIGTTITIDDYNSYFTVTFSDARWLDKVIVGLVSLFLVFLWPVIITVAVGIYKQAELPKNISLVISREVDGCIKREATWR